LSVRSEAAFRLAEAFDRPAERAPGLERAEAPGFERAEARDFELREPPDLEPPDLVAMECPPGRGV
jgi:hypothetical protein